MLKISLDEAYVFDILTIYQVKIDNATGENKEKTLKASSELGNEIISQIGQDLFIQILLSKEYKNLLNSNKIVFNLVDRKNESEISKLTADANYDRYLKKIELQKKFFNNELIEVKI